MSNPQYAVVPSSFENATATFTAAQTTLARILVEQYPAAVAAAPLPAYFGGCSCIDITAVSADASNKDVMLYHGILLTTQETTATGAMSAATTSTITRANGSFITDGWRAGDLVMVFAPKTVAANATDGILAIITAVAATTLTVNGTPLVVGALAASSRLFRISLDLRATVTANAGTGGSVASIGLLNHANDGSVIRYERKLGPSEVLIAAMQAAVSALPAYVSLSAQIARY